MPELPEPSGAVVRLVRPLELVPSSEPPATDSAAGLGATQRKRPRPGERRVQILQALAAMLEQPGADRITTAALAARLVPRALGDAGKVASWPSDPAAWELARREVLALAASCR